MVNDGRINQIEVIGIAGLAVTQSKLFKCFTSVCLVPGAYNIATLNNRPAVMEST